MLVFITNAVAALMIIYGVISILLFASPVQVKGTLNNLSFEQQLRYFENRRWQVFIGIVLAVIGLLIAHIG